MATDKVTDIARVDLSICSPSMCSEVLSDLEGRDIEHRIFAESQDTTCKVELNVVYISKLSFVL